MTTSEASCFENVFSLFLSANDLRVLPWSISLVKALYDYQASEVVVRILALKSQVGGCRRWFRMGQMVGRLDLDEPSLVA